MCGLAQSMKIRSVSSGIRLFRELIPPTQLCGLLFPILKKVGTRESFQVSVWMEVVSVSGKMCWRYPQGRDAHSVDEPHFIY